MSLDTLKDHEMSRYGYSTRQSGPPPRDHITEYRPAICRGNAMGNTNLWRFLCPAGGTQNCMKTGGKSPYFSPVGGANEAAHILSLMGGRAAIQGRKPNGQLGAIEYTILEQHRPPEPKPEKPERENPVLDNPEQAYPVLEEPEQGNPAQLNTNRSSKEKSKKDLSSTEGSNPVLSTPKAPRGSDGMGRDWMRERESYRELILENIEYDYLIQNHQLDRDRLDELVELMVDTVCSRRETIRIAGDDYPAEVVKSRFLKLDSSHIEYVLDRMRENTTYVRNIKKYLLAALYNAPATIGSYYTSLVSHDLYGGGERR